MHLMLCTHAPPYRSLWTSSFLLLSFGVLSAQVNVLTYHNDFARTGQNTNETILTLANVNTNTFGKIFSYAVDGQIFAQPLYVSALAIPGQGTHNVVFVATMHDSVYALDADSNTGTNAGVLWHVNFGLSAATPNSDFGNRYGAYHDIRPEVGIVGTPVIDLNSGTLYVDAFTHDGVSNYVHRIHALNITTGTEQPFSPVVVSASIPGTGVGSSGGVLPFDSMNNGLQRPALTLAGGVLYVCYSGFADTNPYHGWLLGFNASTLQQVTNYIFNTTPNSSVAAWGANAGEGGLWMGGNGPLVDTGTNLYFEVANGPFNADTNGTEYGDSFIRLSTTNGLAVADYFTPHDQASLAAGDSDLGSGGPVLLPDLVGSASHPHLIVGAGKQGTIFLVDRDNMGHFNAAGDTQIVQFVGSAVGASFATPAYFNKAIYYQGNGDRLKAFAITNGALSTTPIHRSSSTIAFPGATPSVSANGTNNGIVWVTDNGANNSGSPTGPAILHAYNATNLTNELYNSSQAGARDTAAWAVKTSVPTIANGKVYVGGASNLTVYGNGVFVAAPTIAPASRLFTNSVTVTISEGTPGASVYYTLDGSIPSTNSTLYSSPFAISTHVVVRAQAFKTGGLPSAVTSASFWPYTGLYDSAILADVPVAYWRFNETNGPTAFDAVNGLDATYGAASVLGLNGPQGPTFPGLESWNLAVGVSGASSWPTAPPLNLNTNAVTILAWLYPNGNQPNYTGILISRNGGDASGFNYTTNNLLGYTWNNNSSATYNWYSGLQVPLNRWSLVALVISPSNAKAYLINTNGLFSATNSIAHNAEAFSASSWIADDMGSTGRAFNGVIDEVAVFNYSLSATQLQQLYTVATTIPTVTITIQPSGTNLVLTWPSGTLQQSDTLTGPYTNVSNAISPYTASPAATQQFYRVHVQ
jgi:hypothetical protein